MGTEGKRPSSRPYSLSGMHHIHNTLQEFMHISFCCLGSSPAKGISSAVGTAKDVDAIAMHKGGMAPSWRGRVLCAQKQLASQPELHCTSVAF
jgi:hypothetical protein